jgi:diguanylate cyclase (GGDEF)-like protein/PAS domain S-box-containing protein
MPLTPQWIILSVIFFSIGSSILLLIRNQLLTNRLKIKAKKVEAQEQQIHLLATNMNEWIWALDTTQQFSYLSPSLNKVLGYSANQLLNKSLSEVLHPSDIERTQALISHSVAVAQRNLLDNKPIEKHIESTLELSFRHRNGAIVWAETTLRIFFDKKGGFASAQGSSRDVTERREAEETIRKLAFNDPLTQLPNRRLLSDRIRQAQAGCSRHKQYCALFFIDIDNFKYVNDNYGHDNGDLLLQQVAQRLFANARTSDTVARFGGDEFVVVSEFLHPDYDQAYEQSLLIGVKLIELFEHHFSLRDINCRLTASIGVYLFNSDDRAVDYLVKQADVAMYQAKARGRNRLVFSGEEVAASKRFAVAI